MISSRESEVRHGQHHGPCAQLLAQWFGQGVQGVLNITPQKINWQAGGQTACST